MIGVSKALQDLHGWLVRNLVTDSKHQTCRGTGRIGICNRTYHNQAHKNVLPLRNERLYHFIPYLVL